MKTYSFQDHPNTICYAWGSIGARSIQANPKRLSIPSSSPIVQVFAGTNQTSFAISSSGQAYSWGSRNIGRIIKSNRDVPTQLHPLICRTVHSCSLGEDHGLLLDDEGKVYAFGSSSGGKLGISDLKGGQIITTPRKVDVQGRCVAISCGQSTSTVVISNSDLNTESDILMLGTNVFPEQRKKINNRRRDNEKPFKFHFPYIVSVLSSGSNHVLMVANQRLFGWGSNENGRLAQKKISTIITEPIEIMWFSENDLLVESVAAGSAHSIVLSEGKIYCFGWNLYYQCGIIDQEDILEPFLLSLHSATRSVYAGFAHSAAVTLRGELLCWGFNEEGQCGLGHERNVPNPSLVEFPKDCINVVVSVALGGTHTIALTSDLSILEYFQRKERAERENRASSVICRFFRCALVQIQVKKLINVFSESNVEGESFGAVEDISKQDVTFDQLDQSDLSSFSDTSSFHSVIDSSPGINSSFIVEIIAMQEADEYSHIYSKQLNHAFREKYEAKIRILKELNRRFEMACMCKEDKLASQLREEKRAISRRRREETSQKRLLDLRHPTRRDIPKMQSSNSTANKTTNKYKSLATKKKSQSLRESRKLHHSDRILLPSIEKNVSNSSINLNRKRNEVLLRRRDARIKREKADEENKREQIMKERMKKEQEKMLEQENERNRIEQMAENFKNNLDIQKRYNQALLSEMKNPYTKNSMFDPIQLTPLKSVKEWIEQLESSSDSVHKKH